MLSFPFLSFLRRRPALPAALLLALLLAPARGADDARIAERLRTLLEEAPRGTTVSLVVERVGAEAPLFALRPDAPMLPASNMKLITTAAALHHLGPDHRFETQVLCRGEVRNGALAGDLLVVGSGDPSISGRFTERRDDATAVFRDWAKQLKERNVHLITGDVIGDDDAFDEKVLAEGWPEDQIVQWYCAEVSALTMNDGCVEVVWLGGDQPGEPPRFELNPPTGHMLWVNEAATRRSGLYGSRSYERLTDSPNTMRIRGAVPPGKSPRDTVAVENATLFFASVLRKTLLDEGVAVGGAARDLDETADKSSYRTGLELLFTHRSPPLLEIVRETNLHSQNLFAELTLKHLGAWRGETGSFESGGRAVAAFFKDCGVPSRNVTVADGSGLSRLNRVTAACLTGVLRAADGAPWGEALRKSLPVGGETGSLESRFWIDGRRPAAAARVQAKTGYIKGVRALSGWAEQPDGTRYRFSILVNSVNGKTGFSSEWLDRTAAALAQP